MKKRKTFFKRVIAAILIISILPISSLEDIFVLKARAESTWQGYSTEMQENSGGESPDGYAKEILEEASEEAEQTQNNSSEETQEAGKPETEKPETEKPETEKPETEKPETEKTEAEKPEAEKPETEKTETEKTEAGKPETEKPEAGKPEAENQSESACQLSLTGSMDEGAFVCLQWDKASGQNDAARYYTYEVCRNGETISVFTDPDTDSFIYVDENTEASMAYEYYIEVKNLQNERIGTSNIITLTMPEALTISSDLTLTEDMQVFSLEHLAGTLDLNGYVLTVNRDYTQTSGFLNFHEGSLICHGDFSVKGTRGKISMTDANDYLHVKGNMSLQNMGGTYYTQLTNGILELEGDLTADVYDDFQPSGFHKVVLCGNGLQKICFTPKNRFHILEVTNNSEEGIQSDRGINYTSFLENGCRITIGDREGLIGYTLEEDTVVEDCYLVAGTMDLNGHTLTVNGDFIQAGGVLAVNGGSFIVNGDYRMQAQRQQEDGSLYDMSSGTLRMTDEADYVCIGGSFATSSSADHGGSLTAGTMEVKGGFAADSAYSPNNFAASGSHLLVLCGESGQKVSMGDSAPDRSRFASLEIRNKSSEGITFEGAPYVSTSLKDNGCKVSGSVGIGTDTEVFGGSYAGDICIRQNTALKGKLSIGGDLYVENRAYLYVPGDVGVKGSLRLGKANKADTWDYGRLVMQKGSLSIGGDLTTEQESCYNYAYFSGIAMTNPEDRIHVKGDMGLTWCSYFAPTAGLLELEGNLTDRCGIQAKGSHRFLLSGQQKQEMALMPNTSFAVVELQNHSREGVHFSSPFLKIEFIRNNCRVTYGDEDIVCGYVLDADEIWDGDLILGDGILDLNGHTMTVTGDFLQMAGDVKVNGGHLIIKGDYRIQYREGGTDAPVYSESLGQLFLKNEKDRVTVFGDFVMQPRQKMAGNLTAGTLEIAGNFTQIGNYGYQASGSNTLVFNGSESQTFMAEAVPVVSGFHNKNNKSLVLLSGITATGKVADPYGTIGGTGILSVENPANIVEGSYSGSLALTGNAVLQNDLKIGGSLTLHRSLHTAGHIIYAKNLILNESLYVEDGKIYLTEDMDVNARGRLIMQDEEGYVLVGGSFCTRSNYDHTGLLTDGILEIRGNFSQYYNKNFVASENHTVILSRKLTTSGRDYIQTISFGAPATG